MMTYIRSGFRGMTMKMAGPVLVLMLCAVACSVQTLGFDGYWRSHHFAEQEAARILPPFDEGISHAEGSIC